LLMGMVISLTLVGCQSGNRKQDSKAEEKQIVLRLGHEMPEDHPYHIGAEKFAELVFQKTNGQVKVNIYPNGTLGKQSEMVESVAMGTLDLAEVVTIVLESVEPKIGVLTVPYLFRDWDHTYKVVDGEIGKEMSKLLEPKGIKILAYFQNGLCHISSRVPIYGPNDVKGLKLRVQQGPTFVEAGKALGAVVTPMSYSEVYSALQLGTIDAQIAQQINNIRANKHYEVAPYLTLNAMYYLLEPLLMSTKVYNSLPEDIQKAIDEAALEAAVYQRKVAQAKVEEDTKYCIEQGLQLIETDVNEWRKVVEPVYEKFADWKDLIEKIRAIQ